MAQQVVIAGALFNDVPSISVPDSNNVWHPFLDTTIASNAAAASDIAQGKLAYVNGSLVTGTNQGGGGGGALKVGVLRPDAVLEKSWTYDKMLVADESITIPTYTTSAVALKASETLKSGQALDLTTADYIVATRALSYPTYSSSSVGQGRFEYQVATAVHEISCAPAPSIIVQNTACSRYYNVLSTLSSTGMAVYWTNSTTLYSNTGLYGTYQTLTAPTYTSSTSGAATIAIMSPSFSIRGNSNYLSSTYWNYITDVRYQYIIELWKIPRTGTVYGWGNTSQVRHAIECAQGTGTLT